MTTNKTVKVEYVEQSKCVTAKVSIEYHGDNIPDNTEIVQETQQLFDTAHKYAVNKTFLKNR